ncbi:M55 family metallopeptidase (plasmid) [Deinococcus sp. KNUC1210]|uniref:M55 family metallopeptidase n=1 Tax=Deinococcus sp. KNUC1210 TaxID=2917691 RepID=UPI001EF0E060|nr:M55 family metallopeptidase [Deinococcus sp. KNUC1210]ULH17790.1 M55 family metallopeptidase [Deinococcus sp. KNUC1210]
MTASARNVVISVDMEGVCGVSSWVQVSPPEFGGLVSGAEYERTRLRMTQEAVCGALGALDGGADEVLIADSHDTMRNLIPEALDIPEELQERVRFVSGGDRPLSMVQGVEEPGVAALLMIGYHARAGTPGAPLAHTWNGFVRDVRINGQATGEPGLNALVAGHYGVPVALISGDDVAVAQVQAELGPGVVGVAVKRGLGMFSAVHLHPRHAQRLIRSGAKAAVSRSLNEAAAPYRTAWPARVELAFDHQARAAACERVPGITRIDAVTVGYTSPDALHLFQTFRMLAKVAEVRLDG